MVSSLVCILGLKDLLSAASQVQHLARISPYQETENKKNAAQQPVLTLNSSAQISVC